MNANFTRAHKSEWDYRYKFFEKKKDRLYIASTKMTLIFKIGSKVRFEIEQRRFIAIIPILT